MNPDDNAGEYERMSGEREHSTDDSVTDLRCTMSHVAGRWCARVVWICARLACTGYCREQYYWRVTASIH